MTKMSEIIKKQCYDLEAEYEKAVAVAESLAPAPGVGPSDQYNSAVEKIGKAKEALSIFRDMHFRNVARKKSSPAPIKTGRKKI